MKRITGLNHRVKEDTMAPTTRSNQGLGSMATSSASALFVPLQHPVLCSVDPVKVARFLKERERYEDEIAEKRKEVPTMTVASFKVSVDRGLLRTMHALGRLDQVAGGVAFDQLTSEHIEMYVRSIVGKGSDKRVNPVIIEEAMKGLRVPMSVADPEARMLEYVHDVFERLDGVGHGEFKDTNPKKTIKLIQDHLYPSCLQKAMNEHLEYQEGLSKNVNAYVNTLCIEAVTQEKVRLAVKNGKPGDKTGARVRVGHHVNTETSRRNSRFDNADNGNRTKTPMSGVSKPREMLCLNFACKKAGKKHVGGVRNCPDTSPEEASRLILEFCKSRKNRAAKMVKQQELTKDTTADTTRMGVLFAGKIESILCADGGSDINLLPRRLFRCLLEKRADMKVRNYEKARRFPLAAVDKFVECDRAVEMDTELLIRHGKSLMIRNLKWLVATENVEEPLLGRPIQEALGLNTKKIMEAACDRYNGLVDANDILEEQECSIGSVAKILTNGIFHSARGAECSAGEIRQELGEDSSEELDDALRTILEKAESNGISACGKQRLNRLLRKYRKVFRIRLGPGPPAKVEPMRISIDPNAVPFLTKLRRYPAEQRDYMKTFTDRLVEYGFATSNPEAQWTSAPLMVQKPGSNSFRMTFDLRRINRATQGISWPMPHIQAELLDFQGSSHFASIDFCAGYWQMPLHEDSQHLHSFITPQGVFKPTRTLQGGRNSAQNFQAKVEPCFQSIRTKLKAWLDDFGLHDATEAGLLDAIDNFLNICLVRNLKVSATKSSLYARSLKWCGYLIDEKGVCCDPRRAESLRNGHEPRNAAELSQFLNCLQWMSPFIPDFVRRSAPLREILEQAYTRSGKRTTRSVKGISLKSLGWEPAHSQAYANLTEQLKNAVQLSHRDRNKALCIFTDASTLNWAAVITQCTQDQLQLSIHQQRHEPLGFLGGKFNTTQQNWSTFEQEAYAIFQAFERMDYMMLCEDNIHLFTDHRNLLFVFHPLAFNSSLGRHIVNKVQRWALYLSKFMYTIEHIQGAKNVAADMLTRWYVGYRGKPLMARRIKAMVLSGDLIPSTNDKDFMWPTKDDIFGCQACTSKPKGLVTNTEGIYLLNNLIWIPEQSIDIQMKLIVAAHCGTAGHRGAVATFNALREKFIWKNMEEDVKIFVQHCIHCLVAKAGLRIPRPLALTEHATRPNEITHFDYLYMGAGAGGMQYILVIRDDLSGYLWLSPSASADSAHTAQELSRWISVFTTMDMWISDQGAHFKNELLRELASAHRIRHNFTVAYSPWINGTVESCMRTIRAACTALRSEFHLGPQDWPSLVGIIMSALNAAPLRRLGKRPNGTYRTPLEVMTGLTPSRSFSVLTSTTQSTAQDISAVRTFQILNITELQKAFDTMHRDVATSVTENRKRQIQFHNAKTHIVPHRFREGDFVLVRRAHDRGHKQEFRWTGPRVVVRVLSETVYEVKCLITEKKEIVHASRLLLYRSDLDGKPVSSRLMKQVEHLEARYEMIERLHNIDETNEGIFIQVQWLGQPDRTDWTWQPLLQLYEDVPERVAGFLRLCKKKLAKKALQQLNLSSDATAFHGLQEAV